MFCFVKIFDDESTAITSKVNEHFDVDDWAVIVMFCDEVIPEIERDPEVISMSSY